LLLDAAAAQLREHGVDAVSMESVKDRAGVSRALLYNYFEGVDDLLLVLYARAIDELDRHVAEAAEPAIGFEAKLGAAVRAYFELDETHGGIVRQLQPRMGKHRFAPRVRDGLMAILLSWPAALSASQASLVLAEAVARASLAAIDMFIVVWRDGLLSRALAERLACEYALAGLHAAAHAARNVAAAA
jgi:AcrR family transcriptional regulator